MSLNKSAFLAIMVQTGMVLGATRDAPDLNPVTLHEAPKHSAVVLVENGEARGVIQAPENLSRSARSALSDLQELIERSTGAKLPIVADAGEKSAIVLGADLAGEGGGLDLPAEGFVIRTAPGRVFITGTDDSGMNWGIYEFLERFVGARFYYPSYNNAFGDSGTSVVEADVLIVEPAHLSDAPVFAKRIRWPSGGPRIGQARMGDHDRRLRCGGTWPHELMVHAPHGWDGVYAETRPQIFQMRRDGERDFGMLCYGNPDTLKTYLEEIEYQLGMEEPVGRGRAILRDRTVTVSPADMELTCRCEDCRALWNPDGGSYGTASRVMGEFVLKLAREVRKRWPEMTVIYLPYKNYTYAPEGYEFPGNVEIQLCGMPGLALYKDGEINASEQENIDAWVRATGRKIQNWHYSCWPANRTDAAYLFPYTVQRHYRENRDKTVGSFINGVGDHWPRQHLSLYVWLKVLWNPDINVDAVISEYGRRMYGPAAGPMSELVGRLIAGWEKTEWDPHSLSPTTVYGQSYPREDVLTMEKLLEQAYARAETDETATRRLDYYAPALQAFFAESRLISEGEGIKPLNVYQTGENPVVDGRLDDAVWRNVEPGEFVRVKDKESPKFSTSVKALWSSDGVTLGLRMEEPEMDSLQRDIGRDSRDASLIWWNDNVEIFVDPSGTRSGYFQLIVNANGAIFDAEGRDSSWDAPDIRTGAFLGDDFWSLEVFIPYEAFDAYAAPGTGTVWHGNLTRHRVTDRQNREYQGFNVSSGNPSHNQNSFGPWRFIER